MSNDNSLTHAESRSPCWPLTNPWPLLGPGLALIILAVMLSNLGRDTAVALRVTLIVVGLIAVGGGVSLRLGSAAWDLDGCLHSAGILCVGALAALVGRFAFDDAWDSAQLVLSVATAVALAGAALVLLPQIARRVVISLLVLFHFGGILTAATSVAPPHGQAPWITIQLWTRIYRPYLQFMYLNNAYHFYSPEPGPPILLWFRIEYEDGKPRWVDLPNRDEHVARLAYQRHLALAETTNQPGPPAANIEVLWQRRVVGTDLLKLENVKPEFRLQRDKLFERLTMGAVDVLIIPPYPPHVMAPNVQYRPPTPYSRLLLASYARHVARSYPHPTDPGQAVKAVKVYRVTLQMLNPIDFVNRVSPFEQTMHLPYYMGEFDRDGKLLNEVDPFLYWVIPIMRVPKPVDPDFPNAPPETEVQDYRMLHAEWKPAPEKPK